MGPNTRTLERRRGVGVEDVDGRSTPTQRRAVHGEQTERTFALGRPFLDPGARGFKLDVEVFTPTASPISSPSHC